MRPLILLYWMLVVTRGGNVTDDFANGVEEGSGDITDRASGAYEDAYEDASGAYEDASGGSYEDASGASMSMSVRNHTYTQMTTRTSHNLCTGADAFESELYTQSCSYGTSDYIVCIYSECDTPMYGTKATLDGKCARNPPFIGWTGGQMAWFADDPYCDLNTPLGCNNTLDRFRRRGIIGALKNLVYNHPQRSNMAQHGIWMYTGSCGNNGLDCDPQHRYHAYINNWYHSWMDSPYDGCFASAPSPGSCSGNFHDFITTNHKYPGKYSIACEWQIPSPSTPPSPPSPPPPPFYDENHGSIVSMLHGNKTINVTMQQTGTYTMCVERFNGVIEHHLHVVATVSSPLNLTVIDSANAIAAIV